MKQTIIDIIGIAAPLAVALVVFCQGLLIAPGRVWAYVREQPWLMARSLFAVLAVAPAVALALILILRPSPALAIGLAIIVSCPPAPMMLSTAPRMGKGDPAFMASMHLSLALLALVTTPIVLDLMSIPLRFHADVDFGSMAWILGRTILLPLACGLAVRRFFPAFAEKAAPTLSRIGTASVGVVVAIALTALFPTLLKMDAAPYLVIAAVGVTALAIGHFAAPPDPREKTVLAVESGVRHPALALMIATSNFSREAAMPVMVPCVLTLILLAILYLLIRGRMSAAAMPAATGGRPS